MNNKSNSNFSLRKLILTALVAAPLATLPAPLWALPSIASTNLTLTSGVTAATSGSNAINVTATADKQVLTWVDFGGGASTIASTDTINYFLPTTGSSILNLVTGTNTTTVSGIIASNGNVFILNPNGITFASTAQVNVGGLVASTVPDSLAAFSFAQNGSISFAGTPTQPVTVSANTGTIAAFQALGSGNNIKLYGKAVDVQGGSYFGNLSINSYGGATSFGVTGNTPVAVNQISGTGGNLTVVTSGGNVNLGGTTAAGTLTVVGNTSFDTTGSTNGVVATGAGAAPLIAGTSGTKVTINAGTGTSAANVTITGGGKMAGLAVNGNVVSVTAGGADLTLGASNVTGNFTLTNTGNSISNSGNVAVGGSIALTAGNFIAFTGTGNMTFTALSSTTSAAITTTGNIDTTAVATVGMKNLSLTTTGGTISTAALSNSSTVGLKASGDISVTTVTGGGLAVSSTGGKFTSTGAVTVSTTSSLTAVGDITFGGAYTSTNGPTTIASSAGKLTGTAITFSGGASGTFTSVGDMTFTGAIGQTANNAVSLTSSGGTITFGSVAVTGTGLLTIQAATDLNLGNGALGANNLSLISTGGKITQGTGIITSSTTTLNAFSDIILTNANALSQGATGQNSRTVTIIGGGGGSTGVQIGASGNIVIGGATAAKGNVTITSGIGAGTFAAPTGNGYIQLGKGAADASGALSVNGSDSLFFGGNLTLNATGTNTINNQNNPLANIAGAINTFANSIYVFGAVTLNTVNQKAILGTPGLGNNANYSYGGIFGNTGTADLSVTENTTLNLGAITSQNVFATSLNGDIVNSAGALKVAGTVTVASNSIFTPGNVTLNNTGNTMVQVTAANVQNLTVYGTNAGGTLTVQAGGGLNATGTSIDGRAVAGSANITAGSGTTTLALTTGAGGDYNIVGTNASGATNVTVTDPNNVTIQNATSTGTGTLVVNAAGVISLGSGISLSSAATTTAGGNKFTATGLTASIKDTAPNVSIFGPTVFTSDNGISITQSGHSLGPVSLITTGANGANSTTTDITYTEAGSANLNLVGVNSNATATALGNAAAPFGNLTVVSSAGGVLQTAATGTLFVPAAATPTTTATFTAAAGVAITNPAAQNAISTPIAVKAATDSAVIQAAAVTLNNVSVTGGSLIVDAGAAAIAQNTGTTVSIFGNSAFKSTAGKITLNNTGNSFGAISISAGAGDVAIREAGTMNLASVATTGGKFTAVSDGAGIIETGNVYNSTSFGAYGATFAVGLAPQGATSMTAQAAGITLNSGNNFNQQTLTLTTNSGGNVTLQDGNATKTVLGSSTSIAGALTVRNTGNGTLQDSGGNVTVFGSVLFDVGSGSIAITGTGNSFGAIQFRGGTITIAESNTMNLAAGSVASGKVSLSSNGNIVTSGLGTSTFAGPATSLTLAAGGNITITNPIFVANGLTFQALGTVDLSALSLIGNLNGITPTNLGAGTYKPPAP